MRARFVFVRQGNTLVPVYEDGRNFISKLKEGERFLVHIDRVRYPEHHRLSFAVFQKIAEATGETVDEVVLRLKVATGLTDVLVVDGKEYTITRSINWESMGQDEYQAWWDDALMFIKEKILPRLPKREFEEIRDIITGERRRETYSSSHPTDHQDRRGRTPTRSH